MSGTPTGDRALLAGLASATRAIRAREGLSQADVARRGGLGKHYPGMVERERANPTITHLERLARGLGLSSVGELWHAAEAEIRRAR
jgi:transcriptional regulator with XRE-family HTH domain